MHFFLISISFISHLHKTQAFCGGVSDRHYGHHRRHLSMVTKPSSFVAASNSNKYNRLIANKSALSSTPSRIGKQVPQVDNIAKVSIATDNQISPQEYINKILLYFNEDEPEYLTKRQKSNQTQTLLRIIIPSITAAAICELTFSPITNYLTQTIHDLYDGASTGYGYETLNLILTDNSNQFIQNVHNFCALLWSILTGHAFAFLYRQQVNVYSALFEEIGSIDSLLEQCALVSEGRPFFYHKLLLCIDQYMEQDIKTSLTAVEDDTYLKIFKYLQNVTTFEKGEMLNNRDHSPQHLTPLIPHSNVTMDNRKDNSPIANIIPSPIFSPMSIFTSTTTPSHNSPAEAISKRPMDDPLETILYLTSVGTPNPSIYDTIRTLRRSRSTRLAALQRKMPQINIQLLYILGFTAWMTFPIVATGSQTVGGQALIDLQAFQLSLGLFAMWSVLGVVEEFNRPNLGGIYNINFSTLDVMVSGVERQLVTRYEKCEMAINSSSSSSIMTNTTAVSDNTNLDKPSFRRWVKKITFGKFRRRRKEFE